MLPHLVYKYILKDKSGVGVIVDKMKDCVVENDVQYIFRSYSIFSLRNCVFQSTQCAKDVIIHYIICTLHFRPEQGGDCVDAHSTSKMDGEDKR